MVVDVNNKNDHCNDTSSKELLEIVMRNKGDMNSVRKEISDAHYLMNFSAQSSNVARIVLPQAGQRVLEIGSAYGNRTKILAECDAVVECIEPDVYKGKVAATLNQNLSNVKIYAGYTWNELQYVLNEVYDIVYVWDVKALGAELNYLVLSDLMRMTDHQGNVVVCIDNKYGIKYWNGYRKRVGEGLFSALLGKRKDVVSYNVLVNIVSKLQKPVEWYYPFPDMCYTEEIYSDSWMPQEGDIEKLEVPGEEGIWYMYDEKTVLREILKDGLFKQFTNSYMIVIGGNSNG